MRTVIDDELMMMMMMVIMIMTMMTVSGVYNGITDIKIITTIIIDKCVIMNLSQ